jgi:hypothetical protein
LQYADQLIGIIDRIGRGIKENNSEPSSHILASACGCGYGNCHSMSSSGRVFTVPNTLMFAVLLRISVFRSHAGSIGSP